MCGAISFEEYADMWKPKLEIAISWVVFVCLAMAMLADPGRDTLGVASGAFVVTLGLAAVAFSYARVLPEEVGGRADLVFAGERLLSAAVAFLFASIVRHASNDIPRYLDTLDLMLRPHREEGIDLALTVCGIIFFVIAFGLFLYGLILAQMGIGIVMRVINYRASHRADRNDFFLSFKSTEQRAAEYANMDEEERSVSPPP
jgi:hypothetical protein